MVVFPWQSRQFPPTCPSTQIDIITLRSSRTIVSGAASPLSTRPGGNSSIISPAQGRYVCRGDYLPVVGFIMNGNNTIPRRCRWALMAGRPPISGLTLTVSVFFPFCGSSSVTFSGPGGPYSVASLLTQRAKPTAPHHQSVTVSGYEFPHQHKRQRKNASKV